MQCRQASEFFVPYLSNALPEPERREFLGHLEICLGPRAETDLLRETWVLLEQWPEVEPSPVAGRRVMRQVRWLVVRDAFLSPASWKGAVVSAAVGVVLSVALSLLIPYSALVEACRRVVGELAPEPSTFLLAGLAYGLIPLALVTRFSKRRRPGLVFVRGVEASLLFLVLVAPYVIIQCREFPVPDLAGFLGGMALGGLLGSVAGGWRW